jgi:2-oxoglutarate ferredoxin oxidoreductase subunit alpha
MIVAPCDAIDSYDATVEAFNIAEVFQVPVIMITDLLLAEHRSTIDADAITPDVPIERGEWATASDGEYRRFKLTPSGVSPRARPGTAGFVHVAGTDDHDEAGYLISDERTNAAIRRKMHEKRMKKMDGILAALKAPELEGPADAEVTLIGWGSTYSVIAEAAAKMNAAGTTTNQLHFKYMLPFHAKEALAILSRCKCTVMVENNYSGQFARHLRAETGFSVDHLVTRYDGEPFHPSDVVERVGAALEGAVDLRVSESEAREMAYHFAELKAGHKWRPGALARVENGAYDEPVWEVELIGRAELEPQGTLVIGMDTGSMHDWKPERSN